jgi:hypothetical protein
VRHILVACSEPSLVDALREAADASTTFLPETSLDEALERLGRSSRIDAVVTEDAAVVAAIREEIPGEIPVHLRAPEETVAETLAALERLLGA